MRKIMLKIVAFVHRYGYASLEEVAFRVPLSIPLLHNWFGVVGLGVVFGLMHFWLNWWAVVGCAVVGVFFGWAYVFVIPFPYNVFAVIIAHTLFGVWGLRISKFKGNAL